jgi:hypothetical protein
MTAAAPQLGVTCCVVKIAAARQAVKTLDYLTNGRCVRSAWPLHAAPCYCRL